MSIEYLPFPAAGQTLRKTALSRFSGDLPVAIFGGLVMFAVGLVVLPRISIPLLDEAFYVIPAIRLAETGHLLLEPSIQPSLVSQVVWGALFSKVLGGGFIAVRVAVLVASALGAVCFYLLLRQLGCARRAAAVALGVLIFNPMYISGSVTFMTEVPFTALVLGTLVVGMAGLRRNHLGLVLAAGCLAALAFLTRQIGVLLVPALAVGLLSARRRRRSARFWLAWVLPSLLAVTAFVLWRYGPGAPSGTGFTYSRAIAQWGQDSGFALEMARRVARAIAYLGVFSLPLLVIHAPGLWRHLRGLDRYGKRALGAGLLIAAATYLLAWTGGVPPLPYLSSPDHPVGGLIALPLPGGRALPREALTAVLTFGLWAAGGLTLGLALGTTRLPVRRWFTHPHFCLYLAGGLLLVAALSSYVVYDRYFLPLMPLAMIVCLAGTRAVRPSLPLAALVLALSATVSTAFMLDKTQRLSAAWGAAADLVEAGVRANDIDAGLEWAVWWSLWPSYPVGEGVQGSLGRVRPWANRPYQVTPSLLPGYVVERTYYVWTPLHLRAQPLYVLHIGAAPRPPETHQ
ncbi:MAG TPA: glycosyltransferase family 39 protein [Chloroflexota bacterium]|nr:glycosyltransferase family 39 protein [Chloroflexota bacterium]